MQWLVKINEYWKSFEF